MKQVLALLALGCISMQAGAQFRLGGYVTASDNEPLAGAYVFLEDTYDKTATDEKGYFQFPDVKQGKYILRISYIGFEGREVATALQGDTVFHIVMHEDAVMGEEVVIEAVRATANTPTTYTVIGKNEIAGRNVAQDLPYILSGEPSLVTTSDAGAGVGYTSLRIRGSDITRINVTINGIPLNDPESHAVFWVDIPDIAGSINSIQIQRGVGSSTNGAGAFGASMNMETDALQKQPFGEISVSGGSFGTWKTSFSGGTGLLHDHFHLEGRASAIGSEGYVDRAFSKLASYFLQGGYQGSRTALKAIMFGGREKTYQAWYGVDEQTLREDRTFNWAGAIFADDGSIRFYENQTDNYRQDHYQLHFSHQLSSYLNIRMAGHYTYGSGYYEEYIQNGDFQEYGMEELLFGRDSLLTGGSYAYFYTDTIRNTDLVRRRWLDNHFYGMTWTLSRKTRRTEFILGGAWNKYDRARHFGEIIWARYSSQRETGDTYYHNTSFKTDFNTFAKASISPVSRLTIYADLQYRHVSYQAEGTGSDQALVDISEIHDFFNPKAGLAYVSGIGTLYGSYAITHREPIRDDYLDAAPGEKPEPETLRNLELGIRRNGPDFAYAVNVYLMNYANQLILTGEINEDGAYVRKNAGRSYRTGLELNGNIRLGRFLGMGGNLSFSRARTDFSRLDSEGRIETFHDVALSFSPGVTGGLQVDLFPARNLMITGYAKYIGNQYLDNTENPGLMLQGYTFSDLHMNYLIAFSHDMKVELILQLNNIFNARYVSNGYVWGRTPYFYPQAGVHFLAGLSLKI